MKSWFLAFVLFYFAINSFGQTSIKGRVIDGKEGLPFATVLLLNADSSLVKGVLADENGKYIFDNVVNGSYLISSSMIGYHKFFSKHITAESNDIVLTDIILEKIATELSEVVVKADKQLFEQYADKLVVNVQSSITSSGNSILEVLQKSPGVMVNRQTNSISINGKPGVKIMINGKLLQLPLDAAVPMLEGMNSSNVDKIELITSPQAKYDAEGSAGIIHIITKANSELGTNGSIGLTLGAHWAETVGGNFNVNHNGKKFSYTIDYSVLRNHNLHVSDLESKTLNDGFVQTMSDISHRENITTQQNLSAGFEWKLSDKSTLNFLITGYRRHWDLKAVTADTHHAAADSTLTTEMKIYESNIWQSATGAVGLQTRLNQKSEVSFSLDYLYYHNNNPSNYDNKLHYEELNTSDVSKINLTKTTPVRFVVGKVDYVYTASQSATFEAGIKAVTSSLDNNVLAQRLTNDEWVTDPFFTSYSTLSEQIGAAYVSSKWKAGDQWQINSGFRYEYTHTSISTPAQKDLINRKYGYLFPSLFITKNLGTEKEIQFSYSRRISRPTYNDMAPYVYFWGPNTFSAGNISLLPALSDALKAGYRLKQWSITLQYSHSRNDIISYQPEKDKLSDGLIYRSQNLAAVNTIGLTNTYSLNVMSWWELQCSVITQYQTARTSHLSTNVEFNLYGLNTNMTNLFRLPKNYAIEISGFYQSKMLAGITTYRALGSLNVGIQKKLGENSLLRFSVDDILNTNNWKIESSLPGQNNLDTHFNYYWHNRFARVTYTHNLGNNKLRSIKSKSGSEEERKRLN